MEENVNDKLERHKTIQEVLRIDGEEIALITTIIRWQRNWMGQFLKDGLLKDILKGNFEG